MKTNIETMAKAGTREKQFIDFCSKIDDKLLAGEKISFKNEDDVFVSVDNSIVLENEIILIEIDANNYAKLIVGQYTLLNVLRNKPRAKFEEIVKGKELVFFVVHCYVNDAKGKKYNPERSKKNLGLINREVFNNEGLKYGCIHIDDIINDMIDSKEKLLDIIHKNIC